jgi:hypothetical protein
MNRGDDPPRPLAFRAGFGDRREADSFLAVTVEKQTETALKAIS